MSSRIGTWRSGRVFLRRIRRLDPLRLVHFNMIERYILRQFFLVLILCLFAAVSLFLVFETFERMKIFLKEDSSLFQILSYLALKIPLITHLMTPVAVLVATLLSIGRMSQLSEITAMRSCGMSILSIARPLIFAGLLISGLMFLAGETIVPWSTQEGSELLNLDIKKKDQSGGLSKSNFWFREKGKFYSIGFYDSSKATLHNISIFELDQNFKLRKRIDSPQATWSNSPFIGWTMVSVSEISSPAGKFKVSSFPSLPLIVKETPKDFFNMKRDAETMSFHDLRDYIAKLRSEGVSVVRYLVDLQAKVSFPFVNVIVILVAFPFALIPARSGNLSSSLVAGVTIGFGYHVIHALCTSLGSAELLPVIPAAWAANILLGSLGGYLLAGAEYR